MNTARLRLPSRAHSRSAGVCPIDRALQNQSSRRATCPLPAVLLAALLLEWLAGLAQAQSLRVDWFTVDGGGGVSTGGVYAVNGTIGQPDAGRMSGGGHAVQGGFWGLISLVQTPGAPVLTITRPAPNTVIVSWPSASPGWTLQQSTNLNSAYWGAPPQSVTDDGTIKFITVSPPTDQRFYRLYKP